MNLWTPVEVAGDICLYDEKEREYPFATIPMDFDADIRRIVEKHNNDVLAARAEIARIQAQNHGGHNYVGGA